jgi:acetolactate synthase-1/2/3 large subunit
LRDELAASDAILAIGTEFGETEMYPEPKPLAFGGPLIRIDIDPAQLVIGLRSDLPIAADAKLAAASLNAALGEARPAGEGAARAKAVREKVEAFLWPACRTHGKLMEVITRALPDATVAGDQTEPVYAVNQFYQAPQVRSFFNSSTGYGTLGYGLPAAFGAKLGVPNRPSVCLIGDGGLQFSVQELASAVEASIATAVVIWNNTSYGEIKAFMAERDIPQIGVDIFTPDFVGLAKSLGCEAFRPASLADLESELKASATRKVPTVIEIQAGSPLADALTA